MFGALLFFCETQSFLQRHLRRDAGLDHNDRCCAAWFEEHRGSVSFPVAHIISV